MPQVKKSTANAERPERVEKHPPGPPLREALLAFLGITLLLGVFYHLKRQVPFIDRNLSALAAVLFLYVPASLIWRRGHDLEHYGFLYAPAAADPRGGRGLRASLLVYLGSVAVIFPLFVLGYFLFLRHVCVHLPRLLVTCAPLPVPRLSWPPDLFMTVLGQLLVVALPEEFFFRGFLQGVLAERFRPLSAVVLSSLLFALGHLLVGFDPGTLAVFFPGLFFGLLRARTGSILAGTLFHASCNLLIDVLHRSFG